MRPYREAIVLAGGFGTRLALVVPVVCKPMAPVAGRPFLRFIMDQLAASGFDRAVVADDYRREQIEDFSVSRIAASRSSTALRTRRCSPAAP